MYVAEGEGAGSEGGGGGGEAGASVPKHVMSANKCMHLHVGLFGFSAVKQNEDRIIKSSRKE